MTTTATPLRPKLRMSGLRAGIAASALAASATLGLAAPEAYTLDPSHSQVVFAYDHLGFSTTYGMFSGFDGTIMFDKDDPAASSVELEIPVSSMITGWDARTEHFLSPDFFNAESAPTATFKSTSVEVTGDDTAKITGDLSVAGQSKPVTLDVTFNKAGMHPMQQKEWMGASASATIKRSDWGLGKFAPNVSDEVQLMISIEAAKDE